MKKILNTIFLTFVLFSSFVAFFPKEKLYYLLEKQLQPYSITLAAKEIRPNAFSLDLDNLSVFLAGSKVAEIKHLHLSLAGVKLEEVQTVGMIATEAPNIKMAEINFVGLRAVIKGAFGSVDADGDIFKHKVVVVAKISATTKRKYSTIFGAFKRVGDKYVYNYSF